MFPSGQGTRTGSLHFFCYANAAEEAFRVMVRNICIVITLALALAVVGFAAEMPQAGQQAPGVALPTQDGPGVELKGFHWKWVVLYFYPKDMTSGCTIEAHNFQRDLPKYDALNAVILGVSLDTVESHKTFCSKDSLKVVR